MKRGFTLAEVLITLSIIGVVAALTMPSLIAKYNKVVWVNQLKKSYSMTSQAIKKMMADEDTDSVSNTPLMTDATSLQNYLKTLDLRSGRMVDGIEYYRETDEGKVVDEDTTEYLIKETQGYNLADGTILYLDRHNPKIYVDVNGNKTPNTIDRDLFQFTILDSGTVKPYVTSRERCRVKPCARPGGLCEEMAIICENVEDIGGIGSGAARIVRDGWKMNY